jgi:hypothetical protein
MPVVDLRERLSGGERLPARLGTGALWLGSIVLIGPLKLSGLLLVGSLVGPALLWIDRDRRVPPGTGTTMAVMAQLPPEGLPRAVLADQLGVAESQLFRARHAAVCTVHHDAEGLIVGFVVPAPAAPLPLLTPDAHPVG